MKRNKHKASNVSGSLITTSMIGVAVALLLSILLIVVFSNLILKEVLGDGSARWLIFATRMIAVLIGTLIAGAILRERYLKLIGLVLAGYLLTLVGAGIALYDMSFRNLISGLISSVFGSVAAFVVLQILMSKSRKRPKVRM